MKASEYIKLLEKVVEKHGDLPLCYSANEEGDLFSELQIGPEAGVYNAHEFYTENQETGELETPTHICLN